MIRLAGRAPLGCNIWLVRDINADGRALHRDSGLVSDPGNDEKSGQFYRNNPNPTKSQVCQIKSQELDVKT